MIFAVFMDHAKYQEIIPYMTGVLLDYGVFDDLPFLDKSIKNISKYYYT